ncbi:hypothetical protein HJFPF1_00243 [Paramyrothecium foliicola]|nr:hypothetical protein HJFPF1_00243 [Paramyrothecium foliicola]
MSTRSASIVTHKLRWLLIASFFIALSTNIVAAASLHALLPTFGLIPLGLSSILAVCFMSMRHYSNSETVYSFASRTSTAVVAVAGDVLSLAAMVAVLALDWKYAKRHWSWDPSVFQAAAYATAPMIVSVLVHAYLGLLMLSHYLAFKTGICAQSSTPPTHRKHGGTATKALAQPTENVAHAALEDTLNQ